MKPRTLMTLRQYHLYLGVFFAPMILLFSVSGALQTFRLQEEKGYGAKPPGWIVWLASVHKDQRLPREKKPAPEQAAAKPAMPKPVDDAAKQPNTLPLKIFVLLMSIGLALSTITGLIVALAHHRTRRTYLAIMLAGAIVPVALLWL